MFQKLFDVYANKLAKSGNFNESYDSFVTRVFNAGSKLQLGTRLIESQLDIMTADRKQLLLVGDLVETQNIEKPKVLIEMFQKGLDVDASKELKKHSERVMQDSHNPKIKKSHIKISSAPRKVVAKSAVGVGIFENILDGAVECPHCNTKMKPIMLANTTPGMYCPTCRHCDYDSRVKGKINAGNPSVEKIITLVSTDSGNCKIKE